MNSWLSLIKSSVNPLSLRSWPKCSRHSGSNASRRSNSEGLPKVIEDIAAGFGGGGGRALLEGDSGGVGAEE